MRVPAIRAYHRVHLRCRLPWLASKRACLVEYLSQGFGVEGLGDCKEDVHVKGIFAFFIFLFLAVYTINFQVLFYSIK